VAELPHVLGRFERSPVIILVTGRTAVARVGGISTIRRHVATAERLGLEPTVLFPASMKALGAEIAGELEGSVRCLAADAFANEASRNDDSTLVIAGDWFISPTAIVDFAAKTTGPAVARFVDRDRVVAPLARMKIGDLRALIPHAGDNPVSELINAAVPEDANVVSLGASDRHRLSDNVAIQRCETKLFGLHRLEHDPWHVRAFERLLAIPVAIRLAATPVAPAHLSLARIVLALASAWVLLQPGYWSGVGGALLYLLSRVLDAASGDLARAAVRQKSRGDKLDVVGDFATQIAVVWAIALRPGAAELSVLLGAVATLGLIASAGLAHRRVYRSVWKSHAYGGHVAVASDNFASRFARRNGPAYGLLLAALFGRLDLFLVAAALASHLFYVLWLRAVRTTR